uniref:Small ribosomal subunit protein uS15c n=1 Tax=Pilularia americana TaxID=39634 RepID=A0A2U8LLB2_PILAM|nr:ribosomal protein S15 [Pilularia americana]
MNKEMSIDSSLVGGNKDTGSASFQIYNLTRQVSKLTSHLESHPKDYSSQRGLWKVLGKRKRLLIYLYNKDPVLYKGLIKSINIRGLKGR